MLRAAPPGAVPQPRVPRSHLHSAVRRCTAQHLGDIVQRLGPERLLAGARPAAERLLPAIARFAQDSSQQTR